MTGSTLLTRDRPPDLASLPSLTHLNLKHSEWYNFAQREPWAEGYALRLPATLQSLDLTAIKMADRSIW